MKVRKIMKTLTSALPENPFLPEDVDIYSLRKEDLAGFGPQVPVRGKNGEIIGRVKKERLLNICKFEHRDILYKIMDLYSEGVIAADKTGLIFYANDMYAQIFGIPVGSVLGNNVHEVEPNSALVRVIQSQRPVVLGQQYVETIKKYVSCRIVPLLDDGEFMGAVSLFSDATELVELNQQVRQAKQVADDLCEQMKMLSEIGKLNIIGQSAAFMKVVSRAAMAAKTAVPVLIRGENGVGKEVLAAFIHRSGDRARKQLITVNCAAIPENLIESELFGYEEGAFTGAQKGGKMGKFEMADGGTLFLDEIGDMSLAAQKKVLRAIQENEISRVGGGKTTRVDVRILTATNQPLEEMIDKGLFRRDLYYRINTVMLRLPSLRERREDIPSFANEFLHQFNGKYKKQVRFSGEALSLFYRYPWPGNIRELRNCIENGVIMAQGMVFEVSHIVQLLEEGAYSGGQANGQDHLLAPGPLKETLDQAEKEIFIRTLAACQGQKNKAMQMLGLSRRTFYRRLRYHGLAVPTLATGETKLRKQA